MAESVEDAIALSASNEADSKVTEQAKENRGNVDEKVDPCQLTQTSDQFVLRNSLFTPQFNGSQDTSNTCQKFSFVLNPSRLNPLLKAPNEVPNASNTVQKNSSNNCAPKFLPLIQNGSTSNKSSNYAAPSCSKTSSPSSDFIFGQNIHDRVTSVTKKSVACENANGTSDMLFSSAVKETLSADNDLSSTSNGSKTLSESAREYEEARAIKRKYEEVEVKTGEEDEINVLQITCKLFAFDNTRISTWQERGRGVLRLNDFKECESNTSHSRLVFRTSGSFRVILNTKIWSGMTIQQASTKSIRLTALDSNGEIKVFLLMGNPEDIKQLKQNLEVRVKAAINRLANQDTTDEDVVCSSKKLLTESASVQSDLV